jgi:Protein of unknown function (DUF1698)
MSNDTVSEATNTKLEFAKFCKHAPHPQNAVDLFHSRWASDLSEVLPEIRSGSSKLFAKDVRPRFLLEHFGNAFGNLEGRRILELGPLEGAHTYQLERLGADEIVAVEANAEAYLKCLIVKELLGLKKARFLYGDFVEFLRERHDIFDIIFCCGVLYHMEDPLTLIELMANRTDRLFLWTHYWHADSEARREAVPIERFGDRFVYYRQPYPGRDSGTFWGGNAGCFSWLSREDIVRALHCCKFTNLDVHAEHVDHPHGPCFSISAWRDRLVCDSASV